MKTLLIYMTSHGCAEKAARMITERLPGEVTTVNLESESVPDLEAWENVIIGGSIRIGTLQKRLKKFCDKNLELLLEKRTGLYICCMYEKDKAMDQLRKNFPEPLVKQSVATGHFGGELDFNSMNAFEKMIIKEIIGIEVNVSKFKEEAISEFCRRFSGR